MGNQPAPSPLPGSPWSLRPAAVIYAEDPNRRARADRLLPATRGGNMVVAEPYDRIVFQRT